MEMNVFIANCATAPSVGNWFQLPVNLNDIQKKIGASGSEGYCITKNEKPFIRSELSCKDLDKLNEFYEGLSKIKLSKSAILVIIDKQLGEGVGVYWDF